jgi:hypothetical protein
MNDECLIKHRCNPSFVCTKVVTFIFAVYWRIGVHVSLYCDTTCDSSHVVSQYAMLAFNYLRNIKLSTIVCRFNTGNVRKKQSETTCSNMYSVHEEYTFTITREDGLTH